MNRIFPWTLILALTAGCASLSGWEPVIDREVDPHPKTVDRDLEQCRKLAKQASGDVGAQTAKGGAAGTKSSTPSTRSGRIDRWRPSSRKGS